MKLVLLHDVPQLGKTHDIVDVKPGFGRNYLLPRGYATFLTPRLAKALELEHAKQAEKHAKMSAQSAELAKTLNGLVLQFQRKAAKGGKLYGSISKGMISKALKAEHAIDLPGSAIEMGQPIRSTGTTKIKVRISEENSANVTIRVAAEK